MTEQEKEILIITAEECGEVVQAVTKILRFGKDDKTSAVYTNVHHLEQEVGDLLCLFDIMVERGLIDQSAVYEASVAKRARLENYSNIFKN